MSENKKPKRPKPSGFIPESRGIHSNRNTSPPQPPIYPIYLEAPIMPEPDEEETDIEPRASEIPPWGTGEKPPSE